MPLTFACSSTVQGRLSEAARRAVRAGKEGDDDRRGLTHLPSLQLAPYPLLRKMFSRSLLASVRIPPPSPLFLLRPFSYSSSPLLSPGRSAPPPPSSNRTAFARITPLRIPASQALPSSDQPEPAPKVLVDEAYIEDPYEALPKRNILKPFFVSSTSPSFRFCRSLSLNPSHLTPSFGSTHPSSLQPSTSPPPTTPMQMPSCGRTSSEQARSGGGRRPVRAR